MAIQITDDTLMIDDDAVNGMDIDKVFFLVVSAALFVCMGVFIITIQCEKKRRKRIREDDETVGMAEHPDDRVTIMHIGIGTHLTAPTNGWSGPPTKTYPDPEAIPAPFAQQTSSSIPVKASRPQVSEHLKAPVDTLRSSAAIDAPISHAKVDPPTTAQLDISLVTEPLFNWLGMKGFGASSGMKESGEFKSPESEEIEIVEPVNKTPEKQSPRELPHQKDIEAPADKEGEEEKEEEVPKCAICSKAFSDGDLLCQSNNPRCHHNFHQACMVRWLKYQNRCPCCNETYVIQ